MNVKTLPTQPSLLSYEQLNQLRYLYDNAKDLNGRLIRAGIVAELKKLEEDVANVDGCLENRVVELLKEVDNLKEELRETSQTLDSYKIRVGLIKNLIKKNASNSAELSKAISTFE